MARIQDPHMGPIRTLRTYARTLHTYIHTYIHIYIHTYIHTYACTDKHMNVHVQADRYTYMYMFRPRSTKEVAYKTLVRPNLEYGALTRNLR